MHQDHLEDLLKDKVLSSNPRVSDSAGLRCAQSEHLHSNKPLDDVDAAGLGA